jgi:hypothetical protein
LLSRISRIDISLWRFKGALRTHIGPVAKDFGEIFEVGSTDENGEINNKYLASNDVAGVALAGVKELILENRQPKELLLKLEKRINALETQWK